MKIEVFGYESRQLDSDGRNVEAYKPIHTFEGENPHPQLTETGDLRIFSDNKNSGKELGFFKNGFWSFYLFS